MSKTLGSPKFSKPPPTILTPQSQTLIPEPQINVVHLVHCRKPSPVITTSTPRAEAAIASGHLPRLAGDLRARLAALAAADYSGDALLQAKKQARPSPSFRSSARPTLLCPCGFRTPP